jgi:hypothetical protein
MMTEFFETGIFPFSMVISESEILEIRPWRTTLDKAGLS